MSKKNVCAHCGEDPRNTPPSPRPELYSEDQLSKKERELYRSMVKLLQGHEIVGPDLQNAGLCCSAYVVWTSASGTELELEDLQVQPARRAAQTTKNLFDVIAGEIDLDSQLEEEITEAVRSTKVYRQLELAVDAVCSALNDGDTPVDVFTPDEIYSYADVSL